MGTSTRRVLSQRAAWGLTLAVLALLIADGVILLLASPGTHAQFRRDTLVNTLVGAGAPILGLVILLYQPRNRIGWLWQAYGLSTALNALAAAIFLVNYGRATGYSFPVAVLIWTSEPAKFAGFLCLLLLILWFPNGRAPTARWRFLYVWMLVAIPLWSTSLFVVGTNWNGPDTGYGIVIGNPLGIFPEKAALVVPRLVAFGFFSHVLILILSSLSLVFRYRSANQQARYQIRWFVVGGSLYALSFVLSLLFVTIQNSWADIVSSVAILPLYLAIGVAILRYRLYDIDLIIRRTLVYALLTALLGLLYFGGVTLLQRLFTGLSGQSSPAALVISTLLIAALFNPLRWRIQDFIDRRFYRQKYSAEQALAKFAATARSETDQMALSARLLGLVDETLQPASRGLWLRPLPVHTRETEAMPSQQVKP